MSIWIYRALPAADLMISALTAVIEELDGTKSYWALAHPKPENRISTTRVASC